MPARDIPYQDDQTIEDSLLLICQHKGLCRLGDFQFWMRSYFERKNADITIKKALARLVDRGDMKRHGVGVYGLPGQKVNTELDASDWLLAFMRDKAPAFFSEDDLADKWKRGRNFTLQKTQAIELVRKALADLQERGRIYMHGAKWWAAVQEKGPEPVDLT